MHVSLCACMHANLGHLIFHVQDSAIFVLSCLQWDLSEILIANSSFIVFFFGCSDANCSETGKRTYVVTFFHWCKFWDINILEMFFFAYEIIIISKNIMNLWDISENINVYTLWKIDGSSLKNIKLEIATLGYANPM